MSVALLDGDIIAYRASVMAEEDIDWGDGQEGKTVNTKAAIYNAQSMIRTWTKAARAGRAIICLSPRDGLNFRRIINPDYKGGRPDKPVAYWAVVDWMEDNYKVFRIPGLEADDVLGILATSDRFRGSIIVSIDKDMKTVPAKILNPLKDKRPQTIRPVEADRFWMTQTLTGDPVDGYKGCLNIGPARAAKILEGRRDLGSMWEAVAETYEKAGLSLDYAITQARLARILRRTDYNKEEETITLWHPNPRLSQSLDLKSLPLLASTRQAVEAERELSQTSLSTDTDTGESSSLDQSKSCSQPTRRKRDLTGRRSKGALKGISRKKSSRNLA